MSTLPSVMATVGEIARRLGQPDHRVEYLIRTRRIPHIARAGRYRLFDETAVARVASELVSNELVGTPRD